MVPATVFVSSNIIYFTTSMNMTNDLDMYHAENGERCQVRQMNLIDELGQVTHIFSDKTGTLTSNHMEFRRLVVDGITYGCGDTAISRALNKSGGPPAFACSAGTGSWARALVLAVAGLGVPPDPSRGRSF